MIEEILEQIGIISPVLVMGLGLAVGIQHAFEPDHVAAVSTQIPKSKLMKTSSKQLIRESITKSSILGAIWGAGHTTTLVLIGFLTYFLAITIQDQIFSGLEFVVGIMLMFLGISTLLNKKILSSHKYPHQHKDGIKHVDEHNHDDFEHKHAHKSYLIGLMHGLAGSGSLVVLTATSMNDIGMIFVFITIFGIGSMLGMAFVGSVMGIPLAFGHRISSIKKVFHYVTGIFCLMIGFNIIYQIGWIFQTF